MAEEKKLIRYEDVYQYAFDGVHGGGLENEEFDAIVNAIDAVETVDAVEVVHGRWEHICEGGYLLVRCAACGVDAVKAALEYIDNVKLAEWAYCPNCGAKMDREET